MHFHASPHPDFLPLTSRPYFVTGPLRTLFHRLAYPTPPLKTWMHYGLSCGAERVCVEAAGHGVQGTGGEGGVETGRGPGTPARRAGYPAGGPNALSRPPHPVQVCAAAAASSDGRGARFRGAGPRNTEPCSPTALGRSRNQLNAENATALATALERNMGLTTLDLRWVSRGAWRRGERGTQT